MKKKKLGEDSRKEEQDEEGEKKCFQMRIQLAVSLRDGEKQ